MKILPKLIDLDVISISNQINLSTNKDMTQMQTIEKMKNIFFSLKLEIINFSVNFLMAI